MQYGLTGMRQETMRQIRALHQPLEPAEEKEMNDPEAMEIGALMIEGDRKEENKPDDQATKIPDKLFFTDPTHEEIRCREELEVKEYWEAGLTPESLNALWAGKVDHAQVM